MGAPAGGGQTQGAIQLPFESQPDVQNVDLQQRFDRQGAFGPGDGAIHCALDEHVWPGYFRL